MTLPVPVPGLVIRYRFLWSHEQREGREEGSKDRPCVVAVAAPRQADGDIQVVVAPITHRPPADAAASLQLPADIAVTLGLDDALHWVRFDELNQFL